MSEPKIYQALAERFGLESTEIREIGDAIARAYGLVTAEDFAAGLAAIVATFTAALGDTPSTFPAEHRPTAQIVIDRPVEILTARLEQTQQTLS